MSFFNLVAGPQTDVTVGTGETLTPIDVSVVGGVVAITGTAVVADPAVSVTGVIGDVSGTVTVEDTKATGKSGDPSVEGETC